MAKIDTILFDFDGTVMDTNEVIIRSWQHTFQTLRNRKEPLENILQTFGEPLERTMERLFPDIPTQEAIQVYRTYHRKNFSDLISLFPGIPELLQILKQRNYKTGLVTSRLRNTTMIGLKKYQLLNYFDAITTAEDTQDHKPDPAPVRLTLERLEAQPQNTIMLGDTMFDILCAKNACVPSVLVSWSQVLTDGEIIGTDKPNYVIAYPMDLLKILEGINESRKKSKEKKGNIS